MMHTSNILSGLAAVAMGGVLIFWIIPAQTAPTIFASVPSGFYSNFTSGRLGTGSCRLFYCLDKLASEPVRTPGCEIEGVVAPLSNQGAGATP